MMVKFSLLCVTVFCILISVPLIFLKHRDHAHENLISVNTPVLDLGKVNVGDAVRRSVYITNSTSKPVAVVKIITSCGCTTTNRPKTVPAHGKAIININFDSTGKIGEIDKEIDVVLNSKDNNLITVNLKGRVVENVRVTPYRIDLGILNLLQTKYANFLVERVDGANLSLEKISSSLPAQSHITPLSTKAAKIGLTFRPNSLPGDYQGKVTVTVADPSIRPLEIPIRYTVKGIYIITPSTINIGIVKSLQRVKSHIEVKGPNASNIEILSLPAGVEAHVHHITPTLCSIDVYYFNKMSGSRILTSDLLLNTNNVRQRKIVVPFYAALL